MTNIFSECRSANIVRDHATILPDDATPTPNEIFGKDNISAAIAADVKRFCHQIKTDEVFGTHRPVSRESNGQFRSACCKPSEQV
jgi:hypothetical protein